VAGCNTSDPRRRVNVDEGLDPTHLLTQEGKTMNDKTASTPTTCPDWCTRHREVDGELAGGEALGIHTSEPWSLRSSEETPVFIAVHLDQLVEDGVPYNDPGISL
jgi:hypothetical protein